MTEEEAIQLCDEIDEYHKLWLAYGVVKGLDGTWGVVVEILGGGGTEVIKSRDEVWDWDR